MNANPWLLPIWFHRSRAQGWAGWPMTTESVVLRTLGLLVLSVGAATFAWAADVPIGVPGLALFGAAALAAAAAAALRPRHATLAGLVFAVGAGVVLGGLTHPVRAGDGSWLMLPALVSFGTLLSLLLAANAGWVRTARPAGVVLVALGGLGLAYVLSILLAVAGVATPMAEAEGWRVAGVGGLLSLVVALSLVLDLDALEVEAAIGTPLSVTGQATLGLLVGSLWAYVGTPLALVLWVWSVFRDRLAAAPAGAAANVGRARPAPRSMPAVLRPRTES